MMKIFPENRSGNTLLVSDRYLKIKCTRLSPVFETLRNYSKNIYRPKPMGKYLTQVRAQYTYPTAHNQNLPPPIALPASKNHGVHNTNTLSNSRSHACCVKYHHELLRQ